MEEYKQEMLWIFLIQSIMNVILITDLFGLGKIGLNWMKIIVLILWNISCSMACGGIFLSKSEDLRTKK